VRQRHAYDLAQAARILNEDSIAIILSEVKVGNIDATRLVRLMKARRPETVSVVFTAEKDAEVVMTLINQGQVYRLIPKPFKPGYIKIVLDMALRRHRQLLESPELRRRFSVDPAPQSTADSLLQDVRQSAAQGAARTGAGLSAPPAPQRPPSGQPSTAEGDVATKFATGLRRLFGG
jgi:serine/threonine-protein kinase